jgi:hypothetical protein
MPASSGIDHAQFQDDLSDGKVRNFDDLFTRFAIGDGEYMVYVDRKSPNTSQGRKISGMQKSITHPMDHETFASAYGSGVYMLTVYGPMPGRKLDKQGNLKRKAFTKPIKVEVPDPFKTNPPVLEMAEVGASEDEEMPVYSMRRGGATDADAEIEKTRMETELEKEEKARQWEERKRERQERNERERVEEERAKQAQSNSLVETLLANQTEELRELRNKGSSEMAGMAQILAAVRPEGPSESEIHRLQNDLTEERRRSSEEMNRLREEHRKEIDRLRDDHARFSREERERLARDQRERDEIARKQVEDARNETVRRLQEQTTQYEARLSDERRQHDRDLQTANNMNQNAGQTMGQSFEMRLEVKQNEINRLTTELAQVRAELDSEKNKTLADRVGEFEGAAEALGFTKDDGGDKGWKEMLGEAAVGLVQNAPALAANVMTSLKGGAPQQQMPMLQAAPGTGAVPPAQNYGPVFATDGVDTDLTGYSQAGAPLGGNPEVIYPGADPLADFDPQGGPLDASGEEVFEDDPVAPEQPQAPPQQPQAQAQPVVPQQPTPEQTAALVQAQQQEQADPGSMEISDDDIVKFSDMFRQALVQGATPEEFADSTIAQLGPLMSASIVQEIPVKRVTKVLQGVPGGDKDPLIRRDGQKFLNNVWALVAQKTQD